MVSLSTRKSLDIKIATNEHRAYFGCNLLEEASFLSEQISSSKVCIVTNDIVGNYYLPKVKSSLSDFQCDVLILPDGEKYKNFSTLNKIYDFLIANNHHRDTTVVALGGGVIGDIASYAASTYQRGVRLIQMPTTLLAQVDSSIGGKTAINYKSCKNMIGSFYYPYSIIADIDTLKTLQKREIFAGFAEIIKYGLLVGGDFLHDLPEIFALNFEKDNLDKIVDVVAKCCLIKMNIVQQDAEETTGIRQILNLGHTFAHGIESVTKYQRYLHGEAVAIGLYLAAKLSYHLNYLSEQDVVMIDDLLKNANLPRRIPVDINIDKLKSAMLLDKKVRKNTLPFIVIKKIGQCMVDYSVTEDILDRTLYSCIEKDCFYEQ